MAEYYAPLSGSIVTVAGGRSVAPGETIKLTSKELEDEDTKVAIKDGQLLEFKKGGDK